MKTTLDSFLSDNLSIWLFQNEELIGRVWSIYLLTTIRYPQNVKFHNLHCRKLHHKPQPQTAELFSSLKSKLEKLFF